jgi:hypothetical protein
MKGLDRIRVEEVGFERGMKAWIDLDRAKALS